MGKRCEWDVNTFSAEWSISWWVSWRGEGGIDGRYIFGQAEKDGFWGEMGVGGGSPFEREKTRLYCATKFVNFIWAFRTVKQPVFSSQRKSKHFIPCTTRHSPVYEMRIYADQHKVQLLLLSRKIYGKEKKSPPPPPPPLTAARNTKRLSSSRAQKEEEMEEEEEALLGTGVGFAKDDQYWEAKIMFREQKC